MKKTLLACAVAMAAITANAQKEVTVNANLLDVNKTVMVNQNLNLSAAKTVAPMMKGGKIMKAEENEDIFGIFVQTAAGDEVDDYTKAMPDTIWKADHVMTIETQSGKQVEVNCNICLKNNFGGYIVNQEYYGVYEQDEDGSELIWFPEQISLKADGVNKNTQQPYHYDIYMYNIALSDDGSKIKSIDLLQFEGDGDGVFYCANDGWGLLYTDRESGETLGWGGFNWESTLLTTNSTTSWYYKGEPTMANTVVEDYETQVAVYGWNNTKLAMDIDDDLTVRIKTGAPAFDIDIKEADGYLWDAGKVVLRGFTIDEENYVHMDPTADYIYGTLQGNTIVIDGIMTSSENSGTGDYAGYWYGLNFYELVTITLNEGNFAADPDYEGIDEKSMTREELIKNTKTYNMMGQQVNRAVAKGLLIRNGKKYMGK